MFEGKLSTELVHGRNQWFRYLYAETTPDGIYLSWELVPDSFTTNDPPYLFTVLRSTEFTSEPAAYTPITTQIPDLYSYLDTVPLTGKWPSYYYVIKLETALKTVYSPPVTVFGGLTPKQRNLVRAMLRRIHLSARHLPQWNSIILKRKVVGVPCTCIDPDTKEVLNPDCQTCYGTGFVGGYYREGIPKTLVVTSPLNSAPAFDTSLRLGTLTPSVLGARFAGLPPVQFGDVFVHPDTNQRFYVVESRISASVNSFPVVRDLKLQLADYKDVIYQFPLE